MVDLLSKITDKINAGPILGVQEQELAQKLKQKIEEFKNKVNVQSHQESEIQQPVQENGQEEQCSDTVTKEMIDSFVGTIKESIVKPRHFTIRINSHNGERHVITLKFYDSRCEIVSDLFPSPFYVINNEDVQYMAKHLHGSVWTVTDFFNMVVISKMFNGRIDFNKKENGNALTIY